MKWWWILVPIAAIYLNGWLIDRADEPRPRRGNLAYAGLWLIALAVVTMGRAPRLIDAFCWIVFMFFWYTAPVVLPGDIESVLSVNPFHKPTLKWGMLAVAVVLVLW